MNKFRSTINALAIAVCMIAFASFAQAQATRTWVSGVGDDANPCSRTAPCKTFAGAISKTAVDGEIDALDPGGFGAVTVTKAITIEGNGYGSILAAGTTAVIINITATSCSNTVQLRNISMNGAGTGTNGVRILSSVTNTNVFIENCQIFGFRAGNGRGISDERTGAGTLHVFDCLIKNNSGVGILMTGTGQVRGTLNRNYTEFNSNGVLISGATNIAVVRDSVAGSNASTGMGAQTAGQLEIVNCLIDHNGNGIGANDASTVVRVSRTTVTRSTSNGLSLLGGSIFSYGNNEVAGNAGSNGPFTAGGPTLQ